MGFLQAFEIDYKSMPTQVAEHRLPSGRVFYINFEEQKVKPLVITIAEDDDGVKFWTSVPEGRQQEAEEVGKLVATHIRSKR